MIRKIAGEDCLTCDNCQQEIGGTGTALRYSLFAPDLWERFRRWTTNKHNQTLCPECASGERKWRV